jgi:hypothetical protein
LLLADVIIRQKVSVQDNNILDEQNLVVELIPQPLLLKREGEQLSLSS